MGIVVLCNLAPPEIIKGHEFTLFRLLVTTILLGWLSDIWKNRAKISRKAALICMAGYYVWMTLTDDSSKMSMSLIAVETIGFLFAVIWAVISSRKEAQSCPK